MPSGDVEGSRWLVNGFWLKAVKKTSVKTGDRYVKDSICLFFLVHIVCSDEPCNKTKKNLQIVKAVPTLNLILAAFVPFTLIKRTGLSFFLFHWIDFLKCISEKSH